MTTVTIPHNDVNNCTTNRTFRSKFSVKRMGQALFERSGSIIYVVKRALPFGIHLCDSQQQFNALVLEHVLGEKYGLVLIMNNYAETKLTFLHSTTAGFSRKLKVLSDWLSPTDFRGSSVINDSHLSPLIFLRNAIRLFFSFKISIIVRNFSCWTLT